MSGTIFDLLTTRADILQRLQAENTRLKNTINLHAGDCISLSGEVDMFKARAEEAEAEVARLQEALRLIGHSFNGVEQIERIVGHTLSGAPGAVMSAKVVK